MNKDQIIEAIKAMTGGVTEAEVRDLRHKLGVRPVFKRIDTCAAEFEAKTPYMYSTYEAPIFGAPEDESQPSDRKKIVILGGGPNRIGQGIDQSMQRQMLPLARHRAAVVDAADPGDRLQIAAQRA